MSTPTLPQPALRKKAGFLSLVFGLLFVLMTASSALGQSFSTGAISGTVMDPSGAVLSDVQITVTNQANAAVLVVKSQHGGNYTAPSLLPGVYSVEAKTQGFDAWVAKGIRVDVTETAHLDIKLKIGSVTDTETVSTKASALELDSTSQGAVTSGELINNLPLSARNYTQIATLNANVSVASVTRADALGTGGDLYSTGVTVNGVSAVDNNVQMDGVQINDRESGNSGQDATPNPDSIAEFRVQTGQYDATFGRDAGANVEIVTKGGSNQFHGALWEYFRDTVMNANDYFLKRQGSARPVLNQSQFGGDLGGPIVKDKLLFFTSYQGMRQKNGYATTCQTTLEEQTGLTDNNRTASGLAAAFAGDYGYYAGTQQADTVQANGSNISPQAVAILSLKSPTGGYLIPTPPVGATIINAEASPLTPTANYSYSRWTVSSPCVYNDNQFMTNMDYIQSSRSKFSARFFFANDNERETEELQDGVPGSPLQWILNYRNFSLAHDFIFTSRMTNHAQFGFHRTYSNQQATSAFQYSAIGASVPTYDNSYPTLELVSGAGSGGTYISGQNGGGETGANLYAQDDYVYSDVVSYQRGKQFIRFGGGIDHYHMNRSQNPADLVIFESMPDFLIGACAGTATCPGTTIAGNGSGPTETPTGSYTTYGAQSNIYESTDDAGVPTVGHFISWNNNLFIQDDIKLTPRLNVNIGFRYDREGYLAEQGGLAVGFNPGLLTPYAVPTTNCTTPFGTGSCLGFEVSSNYASHFPNNPAPTGVTTLPNEFGFNGNGSNTWNPRIGVEWQVPGVDRVVIRAGYGIYHSLMAGQPQLQSTTGFPFSDRRTYAGAANATATWSQPITPFVSSLLPNYVPYTTTSTQTEASIDPNYRSPVIQVYSMNVQTQLTKDLVLEIGYNGAHGEHLTNAREINQACLVSTTAYPVSQDACPTLSTTVTTNTAANVQQRVPYLGFSASGLNMYQSQASDLYNALAVSLRQRISHGLEFQVAYTFNKLLETFAGGTSQADGANGSVTIGDMNHPLYGPDANVRPQRFVASYVYQIPGPKNPHSLMGEVLGGWQLSGVTEIQAGDYITLTSASTAQGTFTSTATLVAGCSKSQLETKGSVQSRLTSYFNTACLTTNPKSQGTGGTLFGNLGAGIVRGPDQSNWNTSLVKHFVTGGLSDFANVEFRAEAFNTFNHSQFSDPTAATPSEGIISTTSVNPRIIQLVLRYNF